MAADDFVEDVFPHMRVHSTERVIHEVHVSILIHGSGDRDPLFLSTTQIDTLLKLGVYFSDPAQEHLVKTDFCL